MINFFGLYNPKKQIGLSAGWLSAGWLSTGQ